MGYAAAGLLGIGLGLRAGLFALLVGSILAAVCLVVAGTLIAPHADIGFSFIAVFMIVFETGALCGMMLRHGMFGKPGRAVPDSREAGSLKARRPAAPAGF